MKTRQFVRLLFALLLTAGLSNAYATANNDKEVKIKTSAKCKMCKARLERTLGLSRGVEEAKLNLDDKVLTIRYNSNRTSEEKLREIVSKTGYQADQVPAVEAAHDKLPKCCQRTAAVH